LGTKIKAALERSDIILLLIPANYFTGSGLHIGLNYETHQATRKRSAVIIPVLIETMLPRTVKIDDINYLPKDVVVS